MTDQSTLPRPKLTIRSESVTRAAGKVLNVAIDDLTPDTVTEIMNGERTPVADQVSDYEFARLVRGRLAHLLKTPYAQWFTRSVIPAFDPAVYDTATHLLSIPVDELDVGKADGYLHRRWNTYSASDTYVAFVDQVTACIDSGWSGRGEWSAWIRRMSGTARATA